MSHGVRTSARDLWAPTLSRSRWFQGKGRDGTLTSIEPLGWIVEPGPDVPVAVRPELALVTYPDGTTETYQLIVGYRTDEGPPGSRIGRLVMDQTTYHVHDAPRDPDAMTPFLAALLAGCTVPSPGGTVTSHVARPLPQGVDLTPRWYAGEQSNSSVVYGETAILKFFRKLEPGPNLDVEIHEAMREAGVASVAVLHGWLACERAGLGRTDLAMLVQRLPQPRDGWLEANDSCRAGTSFRRNATALGLALREVHAALAQPGGIRPGADILPGMLARLDQVASEVAAVRALVPALRARLAPLADLDVPVQRIHGDFHLGQTLRTPEGWRIIDFEGEPLKSMAERRRPDSPWRDVAGMLRSFDYATRSRDEPRGPADEDWLQSARSAFLDAYHGPLDAAEDVMLAAYEADKAIYEVLYEVRNRPTWVDIPLSALARLAATPVGDGVEGQHAKES